MRTLSFLLFFFVMGLWMAYVAWYDETYTLNEPDVYYPPPRLHPYTDTPALRILVITMGNRHKSCMRLLNSLVNTLNPDDDQLDLDVWFDADPNQASIDAVQSLYWPHGEFKVHVWPQPAGLARQWLDTWELSTPGGLGNHTTELGLVLEDDLEVSPHYWRWLKAAHTRYATEPRIGTYSLMRVNLCAKRCGVMRGGREPVFAYKLIGTWGTAFKASYMQRLRAHYADLTLRGIHPRVPGLTPDDWYATFVSKKTTRRMWEMYPIHYAEHHPNEGGYTLYAKCAGGYTLSSNWREPGLNYAGTAKRDWPTLKTWQPTLTEFPDTLTYLDWSGRGVVA